MKKRIFVGQWFLLFPYTCRLFEMLFILTTKWPAKMLCSTIIVFAIYYFVYFCTYLFSIWIGHVTLCLTSTFYLKCRRWYIRIHISLPSSSFSCCSTSICNYLKKNVSCTIDHARLLYQQMLHTQQKIARGLIRYLKRLFNTSLTKITRLSVFSEYYFIILVQHVYHTTFLCDTLCIVYRVNSCRKTPLQYLD